MDTIQQNQQSKQLHVVGVILYNDARQVLLQLRDDKPGLRYPNHWTFFGGAVEDGEAPDDAIHRELLEELELQGVPLTSWISYECPARTIPGQVVTTNHMYIGHFTRPVESLTLHEGQAMRYFSQDETRELTLAFEQSPILARFFETFDGEMR